MIKITKLTDYALILLCELNTEKPFPAKELSIQTKIPLATTNKILRLLTPEICSSKGGKFGGYLLAKEPEEISLLNILDVMEGEGVSITDCSSSTKEPCSLHQFCKTKTKLNAIDKEIKNVLSKKTLADLKE